MAKYNFGRSGLSVNGVPINGDIPTTFGNTANEGGGKVFYVNPTTGSDGNKGTSMEKPLASLTKANSLVTSNNHDVVVLSATSAHAQTEELTVTKNRNHWFGMDAVGRYLGQRSRVTMGVTTTAGTIAIVQTTGVGTTWQNIKFDSSDTLATSLYAFADGGEYTRMVGCEVVKSSLLSDTGRAALLCNGDSSYYSHCAFGSLVYIVSAKSPIVLLNRETITGKVARDVTFEDCMFLIKTSSTDASAIHGDGATDIERLMYLKNCLFVNAVLGSADCDQAVEFDASPTEGYIVADNCTAVGFTAFSTTTGVFSGTAVKSATGPEAIQSS